MKTLDLHGIRHAKAEIEIEEFVLLNDLPLKIITGNSVQMQEIMHNVLGRHRLQAVGHSEVNLGSFVIILKGMFI